MTLWGINQAEGGSGFATSANELRRLKFHVEVEPGCQFSTLFNLTISIMYERGFLELRLWEQAS